MFPGFLSPNAVNVEYQAKREGTKDGERRGTNNKVSGRKQLDEMKIIKTYERVLKVKGPNKVQQILFNKYWKL